MKPCIFSVVHVFSLKYIYRQENEDFIAILNEIRDDQLTATSAKILNERFDPDFNSKGDQEGYITLTTHNNRANRINESTNQS